MDQTLISSPTFGARFETALSRSPGETSSLAHLQIPDSALIRVLSDPVSVSDRVDTGADEIAEIVSSHIRRDRHTKTTAASVGDDTQSGRDGNSVVTHFKPLSVLVN